MLPQVAWPPKDIIHRSPLEYLDWISQLPKNIRNEVAHFTLPCSILVQKEKVCLSGGPGLAAFQQATVLFMTWPYLYATATLWLKSDNPGNECYPAKEG